MCACVRTCMVRKGERASWGTLTFRFRSLLSLSISCSGPLCPLGCLGLCLCMAMRNENTGPQGMAESKPENIAYTKQHLLALISFFSLLTGVTPFVFFFQQLFPFLSSPFLVVMCVWLDARRSSGSACCMWRRLCLPLCCGSQSAFFAPLSSRFK